MSRRSKEPVTPELPAGPPAPAQQPHEQAMDKAFRLLAVRARTAAELGQRLGRAGFAPDVVQAVCGRLLELGYLDDAAFAQAWIAERGSGARGSGRHRLAWELAGKGLSREAIDAALAEHPAETERATALAVARAALARSRGLDAARTRQRIYQTLARRGFDRDAIDHAMTCLAEPEAPQ